jgi:hypothetical protein
MTNVAASTLVATGKKEGEVTTLAGDEEEGRMSSGESGMGRENRPGW